MSIVLIITLSIAIIALAITVSKKNHMVERLTVNLTTVEASEKKAWEEVNQQREYRAAQERRHEEAILALSVKYDKEWARAQKWEQAALLLRGQRCLDNLKDQVDLQNAAPEAWLDLQRSVTLNQSGPHPSYFVRFFSTMLFEVERRVLNDEASGRLLARARAAKALLELEEC
jgi:hypothetical protein